MANIVKAIAIAAGTVVGVFCKWLGLDFATSAMVGTGTAGLVTVSGRAFAGQDQRTMSDLTLIGSSLAGAAAAYALANDPTEAVALTLSGPGGALLFSTAANLGHDGAQTTHRTAQQGAAVYQQGTELAQQGLEAAKKRVGY